MHKTLQVLAQARSEYGCACLMYNEYFGCVCAGSEEEQKNTEIVDDYVDGYWNN